MTLLSRFTSEEMDVGSPSLSNRAEGRVATSRKARPRFVLAGDGKGVHLRSSAGRHQVENEEARVFLLVNMNSKFRVTMAKTSKVNYSEVPSLHESLPNSLELGAGYKISASLSA